MLPKATKREPILFQTSTGLMMGLVCYNQALESLTFVLEKREFFDLEWPAWVTIDAQGWRPIPLMLEHIVLQRINIVWYTPNIPDILLQQYRNHLPISPDSPPKPSPPKGPQPTKEEKIVKFPGAPKQGD